MEKLCENHTPDDQNTSEEDTYWLMRDFILSLGRETQIE